MNEETFILALCQVVSPTAQIERERFSPDLRYLVADDSGIVGTLEKVGEEWDVILWLQEYRDSAVSGDGPRFTCKTLQEAVRKLFQLDNPPLVEVEVYPGLMNSVKSQQALPLVVEISAKLELPVKVREMSDFCIAQYVERSLKKASAVVPGLMLLAVVSKPVKALV